MKWVLFVAAVMFALVLLDVPGALEPFQLLRHLAGVALLIIATLAIEDWAD